MRYGILSDIHSNLEAYEAVIDTLKKENPDKIVVVGDIVGYGADPKECIRLTRFLTDNITCGNHDWAAVGLMNIKWFNYNARRAVQWTKDILNGSEEEFLKKLNLIFEDENIIAVHGSLDNPQDFNYIFYIEDAIKTFSKMDKRPCFIGHSHSPVFFMRDKERIDVIFDEAIRLEEGKQYIINVGSVGQPRDGDNRAACAVYDVREQLITIKRVEYNIRETQEKILNAGLPEILAYRLSEGR
ncbi:MAG: metallophosphoesterase family protein [Candidatus Omnitrophica bacterium]|nr:metallophosphoesterase family protein [Candidatus Omnitrophota bacterium]